MIYIYSLLFSVFMTGAATGYLIKKKYYSFVPVDTHAEVSAEFSTEVVEASEDDSSADETENETLDDACYNKKQAIVITGVFFLFSFLINYLLYTYTVVMNEYPMPFLFAKMAIMNGIIGCAALTDQKRHKIPNLLILFGLVSRLIIYILEFIWAREIFFIVLKNDGIGFLIGFVLLFIIAVITKGGIGFGDVKLFGVLGLMAGSGGVFITLFLSLALNSVTALILIGMKKKTMKSKMPMAPFIYAGYALVCIIGLF